jgi:signal transduction histidine kinase
MTNKILIVDNNQANIENLSANFKSEGFLIEYAISSMNALEKLTYFEPELILLYALSNDDDGYELCKIIKNSDLTNEIPVIFITELNQPDDLEKAFGYGAVDYITKPFSYEELIARVKNHFRIIQQNKIIKKQIKELKELNEEKNGIIELTAHDLKNPLQSIIGFSDLLIAKLPETEHQLLSYTHSIKSSALKAVNIIKDLNDVNLIEEGKLSFSIAKFDLREVLIKIVEDYLFSAESKRQIIIYDEYESELFIYSDKIKLARIFDNLISNALKFSNPGTKIYVKCEVCNNYPENIHYASVTIKDEGPGFNDDDLSKIYGKFAKLSAKPTSDETSTGLGLSIVKKLTELLGGELYLESKVGIGSNFNLKFKLAD